MTVTPGAVASPGPGAVALPGPGAVYISQTMNFMAPVIIGDTITAVATITAIDEKRRRVTLKTQCLNGDKVVIDGEAVVLVPRRDAACTSRASI